MATYSYPKNRMVPPVTVVIALSRVSTSGASVIIKTKPSETSTVPPPMPPESCQAPPPLTSQEYPILVDKDAPASACPDTPLVKVPRIVIFWNVGQWLSLRSLVRRRRRLGYDRPVISIIEQRHVHRHMPRGIDHVDGVVVAVGVEVLRPGVESGAGVGILREEAGGGGIVVPRVHVQQARGVRYAPRERHFVEERIAAGRRHAVPPGGWRIRLPPGAGMQFLLSVMRLSRCRPSERLCCSEWYVVRRPCARPMRLVRIRRRGRHARGKRLAHPGQAGERVVGIGSGGAAAIGNGGVVSYHIIGRLRCQIRRRIVPAEPLAVAAQLRPVRRGHGRRQRPVAHVVIAAGHRHASARPCRCVGKARLFPAPFRVMLV